MGKTVEQILLLKPEARPRIYAYSIADKAHKGLLKVGQTTRDVRRYSVMPLPRQLCGLVVVERPAGRRVSAARLCSSKLTAAD